MSKIPIFGCFFLAILISSCAVKAVQNQETTRSAVFEPGALDIENAPLPPRFDEKIWDEILTKAHGQTVNFYMWGGSDVINAWVTGYAASAVKDRYGITLNMVPIPDIIDTVNKVLGEKQAGKTSGGSVDLIWINGENFYSMRQAALLFGPWSKFIPNSRYVDWEDPSVAYDFGYPVEGYESPYGKAQFVMIYDSARIPEPPRSIPALFEWVIKNPGRFTYAAPPDFTGSVFVRHVCFSAAGGYQKFLGEFDDSVFLEEFAPCWEMLKDVKPSLWRGGETYPENRTRMQDLFANGEIDFDMSYNPAEASSFIAQGKYPETARTFVFDDGTIANTHYLAIPFNSNQKAAAMVTANFLLSPEAQLSKADPAGWGDPPALSISLLPPEWQAKFDELPRGPATLPDAVLAAHRLPELQAAWLTAIESAWEQKILYDQ